jgi:hypothetical protein
MKSLDEIVNELEQARVQAREARQRVNDLVRERRIARKKTRLTDLLYELIKEKAL